MFRVYFEFVKGLPQHEAQKDKPESSSVAM